MLDNFVGSDIFYAGITTYLNQYAYQNAETSNLFSILQDAVGSSLDITPIMDTWTRQMGFPVVNVAKDGNVYTLTQKRFLADPKAVYDPAESKYGYVKRDSYYKKYKRIYKQKKKRKKLSSCL